MYQRASCAGRAVQTPCRVTIVYFQLTGQMLGLPEALGAQVWNTREKNKGSQGLKTLGESSEVFSVTSAASVEAASS